MSTTPFADQIVTWEDIRQELNWVESALTTLSSDDDFLRAILQNQKVMLMAQLQRLQGGFDLSNVPVGVIGRSAEPIQKNDTGLAVFTLGGTTYRASVTAEEDIGAFEGVVVSDTGNTVRRGDGLANTESSLDSIPGTTFEVDESNTVSVAPGEEETIIEIAGGQIVWTAVGTTNETNTEYQYLTASGELFDDPLDSSMGTPASPFEFPRPLFVAGPIEVQVKRDPSASASANYVSHVQYIRLS